MLVQAAGASAGLPRAPSRARSITRAASALSGTRWYSAGRAVMKLSFSASGRVARKCRAGSSVSATLPSTISTCSSY